MDFHLEANGTIDPDYAVLAYRIILEGDSYRAPKNMPQLPVSGIEKRAKN